MKDRAWDELDQHERDRLWTEAYRRSRYFTNWAIDRVRGAQPAVNWLTRLGLELYRCLVRLCSNRTSDELVLDLLQSATVSLRKIQALAEAATAHRDLQSLWGGPVCILVVQEAVGTLETLVAVLEAGEEGDFEALQLQVMSFKISSLFRVSEVSVHTTSFVRRAAAAAVAVDSSLQCTQLTQHCVHCMYTMDSAVDS